MPIGTPPYTPSQAPGAGRGPFSKPPGGAGARHVPTTSAGPTSRTTRRVPACTSWLALPRFKIPLYALPGMSEPRGRLAQCSVSLRAVLAASSAASSFWWVAAQALGFRSTGREHPLDSRPGPSGVGVAGSAWGYACGVGDDEVGFAASTNSGD